METKLEQAREYETQKSKETSVWEKPSFHVTPPVGWMNDPNGFSNYKGEYHLFFQYHPYNTNWGPMHWGHSVTKDFIKWEQLPCALAPDTDYDGQGCFSGTALQEGDQHILMYTSVLEEELEDGSRKIRQTQSIAIGNGLDYQKIPNNPVITSELLPKGSSKVDFRDPKIWKENNTFYAIVGSKNEDGSGQLALFSSQDVATWKFESIIDYCKNEYGKMWECPDFFTLEGKQVLLVSPQFMKAKELEFHNGNNTTYFVGEFDWEQKTFLRGEGFSVDYGLDFYAPQTVEAEDGRRIMIGWLQNWDNYMTPEDSKWSGFMTIPRELSLKEGKLIQNPVKELEQYRQNRVAATFSLQKEEKKLEGIDGRSFDMIVEVEVKNEGEFELLLAANEEYHTTINFDARKNLLTTDRNHSGLRRDVICSRSMKVRDRQGKIKLRIIMDLYSVEVFVNDGEQAMTSLLYTPMEADEITVKSSEEAFVTIEKYDILVK